MFQRLSIDSRSFGCQLCHQPRRADPATPQEFGFVNSYETNNCIRSDIKGPPTNRMAFETGTKKLSIPRKRRWLTTNSAPVIAYSAKRV